MATFEKNDAEITVSAAKTAGYTLELSDFASEVLFDISTNQTLTLLPVADAKNGFNFIARNIGSGVLDITVPDSASVDTNSLSTGEFVWLRSDGTNWKTLSRSTSNDNVGAWEYVDTFTNANSSGDASIEITGIVDDVSQYMIVGENVLPTTDGTQFLLRVSTDNGTSYDSGSNYRHSSLKLEPAAANNATGSTSDTSIVLNNINNGMGNTTERASNFTIWIYAPADTDNMTRMSFLGNRGPAPSGPPNPATNTAYLELSTGYHDVKTAIQAVQFRMSNGDIKGTFHLYKLRRFNS